MIKSNECLLPLLNRSLTLRGTSTSSDSRRF
jgi:hypothetical protein